MAVKRFYFFGSYGIFRPFIMRVNSGADSQITIPTLGGGYNYDLKVSKASDNSQVQVFTGLTGNHTITFDDVSTEYILEIKGEFPHFYLYPGATAITWEKVLDVKQWGDVEVKSLSGSYGVATNMSSVSASDTPNITSLINGNSCFSNSGITHINNFDSWDMSKFHYLGDFLSLSNYNQPVDWSSPTTGSINTTSLRYVVLNTQVPSFKAQCGNVTASNDLDFSTNTLSVLILIDWKVTLWINNTPLLTGSAIDDLANSVGDLTGSPTETVIMTTAQRNSGIDEALWTNKNWTIVEV